jgi:cytochrome c-type biogenesis protein CcmH/NrfG
MMTGYGGMKRDAIAFALSGTLFGLLVGWIIGSQWAASRSLPAPPAAASASTTTPTLDTERAAALERQANAEPTNAAPRAQLAELYFDAERFDQAVPWYEAALKLDSANADVSTNLALAYFATSQIDRALAQIDRSLAIDPQNVKALFTQGVVRARGKQDLAGAAQSWERVVAVAPNSQEARQAQQGLDAIKAAHTKSPAAPPAKESQP